MKRRTKLLIVGVPLALFFAHAWVYAQNSGIFPGSAVKTSDLFILSNYSTTTLLTGISSTATSATVAGASGFVANQLVSIDNEIIAVCQVSGNTLTFGHSACPNVDGRGYDSSVAVSHLAFRSVQGRLVAWLHNQLAAEVVAIEASLGVSVSDLKYSTLAAACAGAGGRELVISKVWASVPTQTCTAAMHVNPGGLIQPAASAKFTISGSFSCSPTAQCLDVTTNSGAAVQFLSNSVMADYPTWFGADASGANDATARIQAAIDACMLYNGSTAYAATCKTVLTPGSYKTTAQLREYGPAAAAHEYEGWVLEGTGGYPKTIIRYNGPSNQSALRGIGASPILRDIGIVADTAWVSGFEYDGQSGIGRSTNGTMANVYLTCFTGAAGDGVGIGRSGVQSDTLSIRDSYLVNCQAGTLVNHIGTNTQDTNVYNTELSNSWVAVRTAPSNNINLYGSSVNNNDVNFMPSGGSTTLVSGVRSEGSKRSLFTTGASFVQGVTFLNYQLASNNTARPATTAAGNTGSPASLTLTFTPSGTSLGGFTFGDRILVAGAGVAAANLHTIIIGMSDPTHVTIDPAISTTVTTAAVTLDSTVAQYNWVENAYGPYVHIGGYSTASAGSAISLAGGSQYFAGFSWTENFTNPFNKTVKADCPANVSWSALRMNNNPGPATVIPDYSGIQATAGIQPPVVYVEADPSSTNNHIVANPATWCNPPLQLGLKLLLNLKTFTLQAGANDLNYAGVGVVPIYSHHLDGTNIGTAYGANSQMIELVWRGAWVDMGN